MATSVFDSVPVGHTVGFVTEEGHGFDPQVPTRSARCPCSQYTIKRPLGSTNRTGCRCLSQHPPVQGAVSWIRQTGNGAHHTTCIADIPKDLCNRSKPNWKVMNPQVLVFL